MSQNILLTKRTSEEENKKKGRKARIKASCFKIFTPALLTVQNATFVVLSSYAQQRRRHSGSEAPVTFAVSHLLCAVETTKFLASLVWCAYDVYRRRQLPIEAAAGDAAEDTTVGDEDELVLTKATLHETKGKNEKLKTAYLRELKLGGNYRELLLMAIPAVLYAIQNSVCMVALKLLDPTTYQLISQLRILVTALIMRLALGSEFTRYKWGLLVLLVVGISVAQTSTQASAMKATASPPGAKLNAASDDIAARTSRYFVGCAMALLVCFMSSGSSVLMEFVFKTRANKCFLSTRNVHLAFFSIIYFVLVSATEYISAGEGSNIADVSGRSFRHFLNTYFDGFDALVLVLVMVQALGGILIALVIRYLDNMMKSFATCAALVLSGIASVVLFDMTVTPLFILGSVMVFTAIILYSSV